MHPSPHKKSKKTFAMSQTNIQFRPLSLLFFGCFFGLITLIISPATQATPETSTIPDEEQPIQITADRLEVQEQKGISTYTGNVHIQQGSLELSGDTVTIQHPNGQLQTVKAYGTPAKFKRFSQIDQAWLTGQANLIQYNTEHKTILLSGDAQVKQPGKHSITGRNIFYDIAQQTLMAKGSKDGQERVSVTFDPPPPKHPTRKKHQNHNLNRNDSWHIFTLVTLPKAIKIDKSSLPLILIFTAAKWLACLAPMAQEKPPPFIWWWA